MDRFAGDFSNISQALRQRRLPHKVRHRSGDFDPLADTIKVMTMHASKGLEFPVVAVAGIGGTSCPHCTL